MRITLAHFPARFLAVSALLIVATGSACAATLWWDGGAADLGSDGDGASQGGSGTWNTAVTNWDAGAQPYVAWVNANNDTAVFGGAAGTVSLGAAITVGGLQFDSAAVIGSAACHGSDEWVRVEPDHGLIAADVPGMVSLQGGAGAVFELDGKNERVGTRGLPAIVPVRESTETTLFGDAVVQAVTFGAGGSPVQLTLTLKRLKSLRAFTLQAVFHNRGDKDVRLRAFDLLDTAGGAGGSFAVTNPADWLVTPLMDVSPALPLDKLNQSLAEAALFCRADGTGFLVGPVGPAEAYTRVEVRGGAVKAWVEMDGVLVRAGESRRSEEMIFCFEPAATAVKAWTHWVATTHGARLNKGPVYGWCSWYDRTTKIDEAHVLEVTKTIEANPDVFGKGVIQIDDGYQKMDGDWSGNAKFPGGMANLARRVREAGGVPGVWFAPLMISPKHPWAEANPDALQADAKGIASFMNANPFHPDGAKWINPGHPKSKEFLRGIIRDARERGYGYIKIDFNGIGARFLDPTKTRMQIFRELYALYRQAAGDDMYILSCLGSPTRGVIGFVDAARVGPDSHPAGLEHCLQSVLRFQIYNNVWWHNDPDVSYLAPKLPSRQVGYTPQGEGMWRTWHNTVALVGGTAMISEPVNMPDVKEVWRNYEILRPSSREPARLLTLGQSPDNTLFGFSARRPYGDFAVYNLYNCTTNTKPLTLDFKAAGLPAGVKCAVFDFWSNKVVGYATDSYTTAPLEYRSSALLRFTPLAGGRTALVGSDLHLSIGATEIKNLRVAPSGVVVEFSDAGAQSGSLTFYSEKPLAVAGAENCRVTGVESLGDNLWKVSIAGRLWDKPQSVSLAGRAP